VFTPEIWALLGGVLRAPEVIGAAVALILFFWLVLYTARLYRKPKTAKAKKVKAPKPNKAAAEAAAEAASDDEIPEPGPRGRAK
jgi:hypothetical protein